MTDVHKAETKNGEDFLEPLGITAYKLSKGTGLSQIHVTSLLLGKFFSISARFWLNLQNRYDLIEAQRANPQRLERVIPYAQLTAAKEGQGAPAKQPVPLLLCVSAAQWAMRQMTSSRQPISPRLARVRPARQSYGRPPFR